MRLLVLTRNSELVARKEPHNIYELYGTGACDTGH